MSATRAALLDRLAAAVASLPPAEASAAPPAVAPAADGADGTRFERFTRALEQGGATWELAENAVAARLRLAGQLHEGGVTRVLAWSGDQLPVDGILDALEVLGIEVIVPLVAGTTRAAQLAQIEDVETGLTAAEAGIASTGSLVLSGGPGRAHVVSQLPRRHIVLLPANAVFATLESWLAAIRAGETGAWGASSAITLISGPSLSEDIELLPALGVHGPRRLHVILVDAVLP